MSTRRLSISSNRRRLVVSNWFYRTRQNDRMTNEELVTLLSYLAYTQVARNGNQSSMESVIDVFRRSSGINVRVKQKAAVTRVLDNATAVPATKEDVIEAIKRTDSFIRKIRTLLIDKDVEDVDVYLNAQLTRLFNVDDKQRYYVRKLKDFYALWYITYELGTEVVVRKRAEIRADVESLFRLMWEETPDEESEPTNFLARVEVFRKKYATADRRLKLTDQEKREMIRRQGNICPICGDQLFIHDDIEVDHIVPLGVQGADDHENLQVAHKICNRKKGVTG
jgi:5-methylcytosine-specific restriction endonuclease McrA